MTGNPEPSKPAWNKLFDFVESDDSPPPPADEAEEDLRRRGVDAKKVKLMVLAAVQKAKARADLDRAKADLAAARETIRSNPVTLPSTSITQLKKLISERCDPSLHAAYFSKLQDVASEADLRSLLEDLEQLDAIQRDTQDGHPTSK